VENSGCQDGLDTVLYLTVDDPGSQTSVNVVLPPAVDNTGHHTSEEEANGDNVIHDTFDKNGQKITRKRKQNQSNYKREVIKKLRQSGQQYEVNGVEREARCTKPIQCKCVFQCRKKINEVERKSLCESYWNLGNKNMQRQFIASCCKAIPKKTRKTKYSTRRKETIVYSFTVDGVQIRVCKQFFLKTLDIGEKTVSVVVRSPAVRLHGVDQGDMRGYNAKKHALSEAQKESVREHIRSFPVIDSHYCRKKTQRQYLENGLTISKMHRLYLEIPHTVKPVKRTSYAQIFNKEFNLGFHQPRKDQCDTCDTFAKLSEDQKVASRMMQESHMRRKDQARAQKEADKNLAKTDCKIKAAAFDMEKVLVTPSLEVSRLYYMRKLSTYNFTVFDLATKNAACFMWHEGQGTKGSSETATCLSRWIQKQPDSVEHVIFYSDTAAGQNRNQAVLGMYFHTVCHTGIKTIDHKYMESGHSQMEVDCVHARIEMASKNVPIYSPEGWYTLARSACRKPYEVVEMQFDGWKAWKTLAQSHIQNLKKAEDGTAINWLKLKWLRVEKSDLEAFYVKEELDESVPFRRIPIRSVGMRKSLRKAVQSPDRADLSSSVVVPDPMQLYESPLGISKAKLADLRKMVESRAIIVNYKAFYDCLHEKMDFDDGREQQ